jgi:hypothetical protein
LIAIGPSSTNSRAILCEAPNRLFDYQLARNARQQPKTGRYSEQFWEL